MRRIECKPLEGIGKADNFGSGEKQATAIPCWERGICICKGRGLVVRAMADNFCKTLKKTFRFNTPARKLLADGWIVAKLNGEKAPPIAGDGLDAIVAELAGGESGGPTRYTVFWHLGEMTFSPYELTVLHLKRGLHRQPTICDNEVQLEDWLKKKKLKKKCDH